MNKDDPADATLAVASTASSGASEETSHAPAEHNAAPDGHHPGGNTALTRGIQVVGILFSAFGGFLTGVAPPEPANAKYAVGVSSFAALVILLLCSVLSNKQSNEKHQRIWIGVAIVSFVAFLTLAFIYKGNINRLTFEYPPGAAKADRIAGTYLTKDAATYLKDHPSLSNAQLLAKFGGLAGIQDVWPVEAINQARQLLVWQYVFAVLFLAISIFSLSEGLLTPRQDK